MDATYAKAFAAVSFAAPILGLDTSGQLGELFAKQPNFQPPTGMLFRAGGIVIKQGEELARLGSGAPQGAIRMKPVPEQESTRLKIGLDRAYACHCRKLNPLTGSFHGEGMTPKASAIQMARSKAIISRNRLEALEAHREPVAIWSKSMIT